MTEITQADRDAAAQYDVVEAFARHRKYGYDQGYYDGRQFDRMEERAAVVDIIKKRIDIHNGFINGLANSEIKVPDELFSALVELRSLLRELQGT